MDGEDFCFETTIRFFPICLHFNIKVIASGYEIGAILTPFLKRLAISIRSIEDVNKITATISAVFEIYRLYNQSYLVVAVSLD